MTEGLPYPAVAALAQTRDGYLWLGTRVGLSRFDGITFTTYTTRELPQLTSDRISAFCEARDGTLWIGTGKGIITYRDGVWSRPPTDKAIDDAEISTLFEEPDGSLLLATVSKLFRVRNGTAAEVPVLGSNSSNNRINAIGGDAQGERVLAGRGLFRAVDGGLQDISAEIGLSKPWIAALASGPSETIWVGTQLGLVWWNGKRHRTFTTTEGLPSNAVRSMLLDRDGNVWVGTSNGLARAGNEHFQSLLLHGIEAMSHVLCLYEDRERNLWVGTDNGLHRVQDVKVANLTQRDGLPINATLCVLQAKDGTRWVGTFGGGLAHITSGGIQTYRIADGLSEDGVAALAEAPDGTLWLGYQTRGIARLRNGRITNLTPSTRGIRLSGLGVDAQGTVWASDNRTLYRSRGGDFETIPVDASIGVLSPLYIDATGGVWLAGPGGAARFAEGHWSTYPAPQSAGGQNAQCVFADTAGDIWVLHDGPSLARIHDGQRRDFPLPAELGPLSYHGV